MGPRHGRHAGKQEDEQPTTPTIVSPHARNLVAEQAQQANENASVEVSVANGSDEASETATRTVSNDGSATDGTTTSVITEAELQDYFARLAREVGMESSTPSEQGEPEAERVQDTDESESSEDEQSAESNESTESTEPEDVTETSEGGEASQEETEGEQSAAAESGDKEGK